MKQRFSQSRSATLAAALALVLAFPAAGTVVRFLSFEEQLALSDLVVRTRIGAATMSVGEKGLPFTETSLEILEVLKGSVPEGIDLRVRQMKGESDGLHMAVPGDAELQQGEETILFLRYDGAGPAFLTALGQSKYDVERPPLIGGGGEAGGGIVIRDLSDLTFYLGGKEPGMTHGILEAPVDLELFQKTVRESAGIGK